MRSGLNVGAPTGEAKELWLAEVELTLSALLRKPIRVCPDRWLAFAKVRSGLLGTLRTVDGRATGEYRSKPGPFRSTASWCF